jgi:non-canonical purine NTP pyrophosphatase (RdgB/HAM1 family)
MRLLIATTNRGKAAEFRRLLSVPGIEIEDLTAYAEIPAVEETGKTFIANACLKASYYARAFNAWTMADDSGLAVDALGGKPGVHTGRWAELHGPESGDEANNRLLLKQMEQVADSERGGRFVCTLAVSDPNGRILLTVTDWMSGRIMRQPAGAGGFGYDPLFFIESHGCTTAEMPPAAKDAISHRGKAAVRMLELLERHALASIASWTG